MRWRSWVSARVRPAQGLSAGKGGPADLEVALRFQQLVQGLALARPCRRSSRSCRVARGRRSAAPRAGGSPAGAGCGARPPGRPPAPDGSRRKPPGAGDAPRPRAWPRAPRWAGRARPGARSPPPGWPRARRAGSPPGPAPVRGRRGRGSRSWRRRRRARRARAPSAPRPCRGRIPPRVAAPRGVPARRPRALPRGRSPPPRRGRPAWAAAKGSRRPAGASPGESAGGRAPWAPRRERAAGSG